MRRRGRRVALAAGAIALAVAAGGAWLARDVIRDGIDVFVRLRSSDPFRRRAALDALGTRGAGWTARHVLEAARAETYLMLPAVASLEKIIARASPSMRRSTVAGLLELQRAAEATAKASRGPSFTEAYEILLKLRDQVLSIAASTVDGYPSLIESMESDRSKGSASLAAEALAQGWPASREYVEHYFSGPEAVQRARWFFAASHHGKEKPDLSASFARSHPDPRVRVLALVYACRAAHREASRKSRASTFQNPSWMKESPDLGVLRDAHASDPDPRVRRAAVRIAGLASTSTTGIDLEMVAAGEKDPAIVAEAIEAAALRNAPWFALGVEAWDGFVVPSPVAYYADRATPAALDPMLLQVILATSTSPGLRDAASLAPAPLPPPWWVRKEDLPVPRSSDLEVHEWGVWLDGGATLVPMKKVLDELPPFVHRSTTGAGALWSARSNDDPRALVATKPVLFFHAGRPQVLFVPAAASTEWLTGIGLEWRGLRVGYGTELEGELPQVDRRCWWAKLRAVGASPVALRGDHEGFLFYDGSIRMPSPVRAEWKGPAHREVLLAASPRERLLGPIPASRDEDAPPFRPGPVSFALVVRKEAGAEARGDLRRDLDPSSPPAEVPLEGLPLSASDLRRALGEALEAKGPTQAESEALLATFEDDFFGKDGVRVISSVDREVYDHALPITILPSPEKLVRVGLILRELE